jgi:signal transduction histidine kinase
LEVIPAYLDSILLNLITNAIKYRSPERQPVIELSTETEGEYLVLLVKDNGLGLDLQKFKDKLFGMYKTFHNNPNSRGIGLFITKNQIEAMNGKVEVESQVNVGTTFKIYFPQIKQNNIVLQVNK